MNPSTSEFHEVKHPYPGLRPFESWEGEIFFGREEHTNRLLDILQQQRFLAIIGPSGSGKSSLVRAGLLPNLPLGSLGTGSDWRIAIMRPGNRPIQRLAQTLIRPSVLGIELTGEELLSQNEKIITPEVALIEAELRRGSLGLIDIVRDARTRQTGDECFNLLVLVDQFEEIFTYADAGGRQADESEAFVNLLLAPKMAQDTRIFVVLTMRTDFLGNCVRFLELPDAINRAQYLTPRLTREQIARTITRPAHLFGGDVEASLVAELINDVSNDPDQLPILQHALARMWDQTLQRDNTSPCITWDNYNAVGGISNALSKHANEILASLSPKNQIEEPLCPEQQAAETLFRAITDRRSAEAGGQAIRRPQSLNRIAAWSGRNWEEFLPVVKNYSDEGVNFLSYSGELNGESVIDISHESLIRQWDRLHQWVLQESRCANEYRYLRDRTHVWIHAEFIKKGSGALLTGSDLAKALEWQKAPCAGTTRRPNQFWANRYRRDQNNNIPSTEFKDVLRFIKESHAVILHAQRHEHTIKKTMMVLTALSVLATVLALGFAWQSHNSQLTAESALLWTPLDFSDSSINIKQADGLLRLARADDSQKYAFLDQLLSDKSLAERFHNNSGAIMSAMVGVNPERRRELLLRLNAPKIKNLNEDAFRLARVLALLELDDNVSINDIIQASGRQDNDPELVARELLSKRLEAEIVKLPVAQTGVITDQLIATTTDPNRVYPSWNKALTVLASKAPETTIGLIVDKLIAAIKITKPPTLLRSLGEDLADVVAKTPETQAQVLIDKLFAETTTTDDSSQLQALAHGLAALAAKVPEAQADVIASQFIVAIKSAKDTGQLRILGNGLEKVAWKVPDEQAEAKIDKFIDAISNTKDAGQLQVLVQGLGVLATKVTEAQAQTIIEKFSAAMKDTKDSVQRQSFGYGLAVVLAKVPEIFAATIGSLDSGQIRSFSKGLLTTAEKVPEANAEALADRYFTVMRETKNFQLLQILSEALAEVAAGIPEAQSAKLTNKFYDVMQDVKNPFLFQTLGKGLAAAASRVPESQSVEIANTLFTAMKGTKESGKLQTLGMGLAAIASKVPETQATALAEQIFSEITIKKNDFLGDALVSIAAKVPEAQAAGIADKFFTEMRNTQDAFLLQALANGLAAVAVKISEAQSEAFIDPFIAAIKDARESDQIQTLANGLATVTAKTPTMQIADIVAKLIAEIHGNQVNYQTIDQNPDRAVLEWINSKSLRRITQLKAFGQGLAAVSAKTAADQSATMANQIFAAMKSVMDSSSGARLLTVQKATPGPQNRAVSANQTLDRYDTSTLTEQLEALGQGLVATAPTISEADAAALFKTISRAVWDTQNSAHVQLLVQSITVISSRLKADEATAQLFFDILKNPLVPRDAVTMSLYKLYSPRIPGDSSFWAFVEWAKIHYPHLDLDSLSYEPIEAKAKGTSLTGWFPS